MVAAPLTDLTTPETLPDGDLDPSCRRSFSQPEKGFVFKASPYRFRLQQRVCGPGRCLGGGFGSSAGPGTPSPLIPAVSLGGPGPTSFQVHKTHLDWMAILSGSLHDPCKTKEPLFHDKDEMAEPSSPAPWSKLY